jgi:UDP-N-acetyl-D-galactosamine dehydrogenase
MELKLNNIKLAVIGLGYVGLPLAAAFGNLRDVLGFDISKDRIKDLKNFKDTTLELSTEELRESTGLKFSSNELRLSDCNCYIVTVPTPVDENKSPDLSPLISASKLVGKYLKKGDIVIYESTVYPGATEDDCVPVLEQKSSLRFNVDFYAGYSPERINPGDKFHRLKDIVKVTSGSTPEIADLIDRLYGLIIDAGTHRASSIKVAEAAKVIENTQRDVNIALINELAIIFDKLEIDTEEVLLAAGSKWNFLPFRPGLVGGHCIGVDPYYLTHKAQLLGYQPKIILAGRQLNDSMGKYVADKLITKMVDRNILINGSNILILGLTFKENCPDLRNTRVIDVAKELNLHGAAVDVYDPWVNALSSDAKESVNLVLNLKEYFYDAIIIAVGHDEFKELGEKKIRSYAKKEHILFDLKYLLPASESDLRF